MDCVLEELSSDALGHAAVHLAVADHGIDLVPSIVDVIFVEIDSDVVCFP